MARRSKSRRSETRIEDLAELAGVSTATVSRALNDSPLVRDNTKKEIWRLAREHNYPFRPQMPTMLSGAAATIGIAVPTPVGRSDRLSDPFFMELIGGIGEAAQAAECDIVISHVTPQNFDDLSDLITSSRAEGVIFLGQSFLHERFNRLAQVESRFVVWGADLPGQLYASVGSDNIKGGKRATQHLLRLGRRRIAFLGDTEAPEIQQRYQGYVQALDDADIGVDERLLASVHFQVESAEEAIERLIAQRVDFDAVVGASDLVALGAIRGLRRAGRSVPGDVSVVGYDNILLSRYSHPSLTTISQDMAKAGRLLVSKILGAGSTGDIRSERLPTELIVRESCGA